MVHRSTGWIADLLFLLAISFGLLLVTISGCAGGDVRECFEHDECASGFCRADGTCAPVGPDGGSETDGSAGDGGDDGGSFCQPNHDGEISRDELSFAAGNQATFRIALDTPVDTAGELQPEGGRVWDLSSALSGESDVEVKLEPLDGTWFAESFATATYYTRLSQTEDLLGVFEMTDSALLLRGVVSPEAGLYKTELTYDPPVEALEFPITTSSSWQTETTVSGLAQGISSFYTEKYESEVDAVGELETPFGDFPVHRIRVELTRTVGVVVVTKRTYIFVAECYSTVATIVSQDYESEIEFTEAAEVRRLAP